jgi:hypothetical protein
MLPIIIGDLPFELSWLYTESYLKEHFDGVTLCSLIERVIVQFYWQVY